MDKIEILCSKDRDMMYEFSNRSIERLRGRPFFPMPLPFFRAYMDANVVKEIDKDRLIIENAAAAFLCGKDAGAIDVEDVFEKTKAVDKRFVNRILTPSLSIKVHYEDIAHIRKERIGCISRTVCELLRTWEDVAMFSEAMRKTYSDEHFREVIIEILRLYSLETRTLGRSIKFFTPLNIAKDKFIGTLFAAMEEVTEEMADAYAKRIYGDGGASCPDRT